MKTKHRVMLLIVEDGNTNGEDPDQTSPLAPCTLCISVYLMSRAVRYIVIVTALIVLSCY